MMDGTRRITAGDTIFVKSANKNQVVWKYERGRPVVMVGVVEGVLTFRALDKDEWEPLPLVGDLLHKKEATE